VCCGVAANLKAITFDELVVMQFDVRQALACRSLATNFEVCRTFISQTASVPDEFVLALFYPRVSAQIRGQISTQRIRRLPSLTRSDARLYQYPAASNFSSSHSGGI
jgi:hypothetical protein